MSQEPKKDKQLRYTPFQIFVLTYLTSEESKQQKDNKAFGRPSPVGLTYNYRFTTSINELTTIVLPNLIPGDKLDPSDILTRTVNEVIDLEKQELIKYEHERSHPSFKGEQYEGFYVTPGGKLFVRKCFVGLVSKIEDKIQYERIVEQTEANTIVKKYFKELREKLIDKSQDQVIEIISSGIKEYAVVGISIALRLVGLT